MNSSLNALLLLKKASLGNKIYFVVILIAMIVGYYFGLSGWELIIYSAMFAVVVSLAFTWFNLNKALRVYRKQENEEGFKFPPRFWSYSSVMYLSTVVIFLYEKIDQLTIVKLFDLTILGVYFGIMKISLMAKYLPQIINRGFIATLSELINNNDRTFLGRYYNYILKANTLICAILGIFIVVFIEDILAFYQNTLFLEYKVLAFLFILTAFIDFPDTLNTNMLIVAGKDKFVLLNNVLKILCYFVVLWVLFPLLGIYSLVCAKGISLMFGVLLTSFQMACSGISFKYPWKNIYLFILFITGGVFVYFVDLSFVAKIVLVALLQVGIFILYKKELLGLLKKKSFV
jgi:O-antigen/teichoic acid export membrane protein